jgi:general secretion pathway protein K
MVLVFALWVLGILTVLAVSVAAGIRQKIFLVARLDERSRMEYLLQAAVKKTAGYIHLQMEMSNFEFTPAVKMNLLNNADELSQIQLGHDNAGVGYVLPDGKSLRWGVVDEESKIDLNKTDVVTLINLLTNALSLNDEDASKLARSLLDWRQYGESEMSGFYSDDYYSNLQYPYPKKNADFETLDEILLVKGMNKEIYDKLINYVTIYGDGAVNINTASKEVLEALGLTDALIDKILAFRRGKDHIDATADDRVFLKTFEITTDLNTVEPLTLKEAQTIDRLNAKGLLCTGSFYFTIEATGKLSNRSTARSVRAVYSARGDKLVYWKER